MINSPGVIFSTPPLEGELFRRGSYSGGGVIQEGSYSGGELFRRGVIQEGSYSGGGYSRGGVIQEGSYSGGELFRRGSYSGGGVIQEGELFRRGSYSGGGVIQEGELFRRGSYSFNVSFSLLTEWNLFQTDLLLFIYLFIYLLLPGKKFQTDAKLSFLGQRTSAQWAPRGVLRGRELFFRCWCREGVVNRVGELLKGGGGSYSRKCGNFFKCTLKLALCRDPSKSSPLHFLRQIFPKDPGFDPRRHCTVTFVLSDQALSFSFFVVGERENLIVWD